MVYTEKHGRWKPVNQELVSTGHKAHSRVYVKFEIKKNSADLHWIFLLSLVS